MSPVTHAEIGWLIANIPRESLRRDRFIIFLAGIIPDIDALDLLLTGDLYTRYHHVLAHNIFFGLMLAVLSFFVTRRALVAVFVLLSFHAHIIGDLLGSGPGWPVMYLWPFSDAEWYFPFQWDLRSWQNLVITVVATSFCLLVAAKKGRTPLEFISLRVDGRVAEAIRLRYERMRGIDS